VRQRRAWPRGLVPSCGRDRLGAPCRSCSTSEDDRRRCRRNRTLGSCGGSRRHSVWTAKIAHIPGTPLS
jgi:hypothetical protein